MAVNIGLLILALLAVLAGVWASLKDFRRVFVWSASIATVLLLVLIYREFSDGEPDGVPGGPAENAVTLPQGTDVEEGE